MPQRTMLSRRLVVGAGLATPFLGGAGAAFPTRPIRMIVPYPPGGGADIAARLMVDGMRADLGQPIVVENRPGASEIIGTEATLRAAPDGHTIGVITMGACIQAAMGTRLPYNVQRDAMPLGMMLRIPLILVTHPSLPATDLPALIEHLRANPDRYTYASVGPSSPHALAMEWFKQLTGTKIVHVPYSGVATAASAVVAGEVQMMLCGVTTALPLVQGGQMRVLGVSQAGGIESQPDWPPMARTVPGYDTASWYGMVAPGRVEPAVAERLSGAIRSALAVPQIKGPLEALGGEIWSSTSDEMGSILRQQTELWTRVIRTGGLRLE